MSTTTAATPIPGELRNTAILTPAILALAGTMLTAMGSFYLLLSALPAHAAAIGGASAAGLSTGALMAPNIVGEIVAPGVIAWLGRRRAADDGPDLPGDVFDVARAHMHAPNLPLPTDNCTLLKMIICL